MSTRYPVSLASRARRARAWLAPPSPAQMTGRLRGPCRAAGGGRDVEPRARERAHELSGSGRWCGTRENRARRCYRPASLRSTILVVYLFTGVTFVLHDASVGRARAAASARDELG